MHHEEFEPPEELKDIIKCFWYTRRDFGEQRSDFEILPDGYAEIFFHFGSDCSIAYNGILQPLSSPFLMGLLSQPVVLNTKGRFEVIGIRCFPWTVFNLLGLPSDKNRSRIAKHPIALLQARLNKRVMEGQIPEAVAELSAYFLQAGPQTDTDSLLVKAGFAIREAKGSMPVNQVAAAAHATVRTLERKFRLSAGYTVKDVSGLTRFEEARNKLLIDPYCSITGLAHELGYADQSHLSREFKRYSGITPAAFARSVKNDISGNHFVAFIQD